MAKFTTNADVSFDILSLDLNFSLRNRYDGGLAKNVNFVENGVTYPDFWWTSGDDGNSDRELDVAGKALTGTATALTGGTVNALILSDASLFGDGLLWRLDGVSLGGAAVSNAVHTTSRADDLAIFASALKGNDTIILSNGNDRMFGFAGNDTIYGNGGNDFLAGGLGDDLINGGTGMDIASYAGENAIAGVVVALSSGTATGGGGSDTLKGIEGIVGSDWDDTVTGNGLANLLDGGGGNDTLSGLGGNDMLIGGDGNDQLRGGAGNDLLYGGAGSDTIRGHIGADRFYGGTGRDLMYGGADGDADIFIFTAIADSKPGGARDQVFDFVSGTDVIDLRPIDADTATAGDQAFAFSASGPAAHSVWVLDTGANLLVRADVNGDLTPDFEIQLMNCNTFVQGDLML